MKEGSVGRRPWSAASKTSVVLSPYTWPIRSSCSLQQATVVSFPTLRGVLTRLLFAPEPSSISARDSAPPGPTADVPAAPSTLQRSHPGQRYYLLPCADKIAILAFLCDAVVSHKEIHIYMDACETNLTQLRKEKIEVKKERKKM